MLRGRESGGGRFNNPPNKFGLSPLYYIPCGGTPTTGIFQLGGAPRGTTGVEPVSAPVPQIQPPTVVHESPHYIVVDESPPPPPRPNPVGPVSPPPSPRRVTYIQHVDGIPYLIRPSVGGGSGGGGGHSSRGATRPCVTGHRRRQSSTGPLRLGTCPAMQRHTSTQRALRHTALPFTCTLG